MDHFKQLHEGALAAPAWNVPFPIAGDDLAQESYLFDASRDQFAAFHDDVGYRPASFLATGVRHDAKSAILIAPLHDTDECCARGFAIAVCEVLADRALAPVFFTDVHDFRASPLKNLIEVLSGAMKFLRAEHKVHIRQFVDQLG